MSARADWFDLLDTGIFIPNFSEFSGKTYSELTHAYSSDRKQL
jgi:hypothetical protein